MCAGVSRASRFVLVVFSAFCGLACAAAFADGHLAEPLDRGLVASATEDGDVYLGWRMLAGDPADVAFDVYRRAGDGEAVKINLDPVRATTDFVDRGLNRGIECTYFVLAVTDATKPIRSRDVVVKLTAKPLPYRPIRLDGDHTFQKVGIADLDGDAQFDFVVKQPGANIDPYIKYWKPSPDTYKLEAYRGDGKLLWRYDLGWAIERGIWYSPYVVYDLNGDGRAEVAVKTGQGDPRESDGRVRTGPEFLTILDGLSGKPVAQAEWPSRAGFDGERGYNYASRNQICVGFLDGVHPHLLVQRGTYNVMKLVAYRLTGGELEEVWHWDNVGLDRQWWGQGAHWMHAADIDADGRDEVLLGSSVIDDDGRALWTTGLGHPDHFYLGDIDPDRPGLEIYYGMETRQKERNGMCLVEAASGKILWGHEGFTRHVHSNGMCSDIDARYPGSECYSADTNSEKKYAWSRLRTAVGKVISEENISGFGPRVVYWDADPQRELLISGKISNYGGSQIGPKVEGRLVAVADILGDWREEIITSTAGELRIYTTTIPAEDRRVCLMQDPIYRIDVLSAAMGYFQVPMTSYDLATEKNKP